ncbi:SUVR5, C2H2-type Zinc finger, 3 repeats, partial [Dillenia turbinata]
HGDSGSKANLVFDGENDHLGSEKPVSDQKIDNLVALVKGSKSERSPEGGGMVEELSTSDGHYSADSFCDEESLLVNSIECGVQSNDRDSDSARRDEAVGVSVKKLGFSMLNIMAQLHPEALIETARNMVAWKEFATQASCCQGYSDLASILIQLQNMISGQYKNPDWLKSQSHSWLQRCENSQNSEFIEMLKEELMESILWNDIRSLWDAPMQPQFISEWKAWKEDVTKWFPTSNPISSSVDPEPQMIDSPISKNLHISRKRPKLVVRRAEAPPSQVEPKPLHQSATLGIDSGYFDGGDVVNAAKSLSSSGKEDVFKDVAPMNFPSNEADRWNEIVVEPGVSEIIQSKDVESTPNTAVSGKPLDLGSKNRQCIAFIESKGRQCVRSANEGDVYCCVHLASRFASHSSKSESIIPVNTPMCEGTTVLGTKCKHRSLYGSSFCKKHRNQTDRTQDSGSTDNRLKRKHEDDGSRPETSNCKDIVLVGEVDNPIEAVPVSIMNGNSRSRQKPAHAIEDLRSPSNQYCIAEWPQDATDPCLESPKRYMLYCEKHLPRWLKRARNGKSRIISKEVFLDLFARCCSHEQKLQLHQACDVFYRLFKSILSVRNTVPKDIQFQWALSEASKDFHVGEFLMKLVCSEKEKLKRLWGFGSDHSKQLPPCPVEEPVLMLEHEENKEPQENMKCKICSEEFLDNQTLGAHWKDSHKKESQWLCRGYACAICLDSFTNRKFLETHVQERHRVQFVEQCVLLQCIPCGSHFGNPEELWSHVLSIHPDDLRLSKDVQPQNPSAREYSPKKLDTGTAVSAENNSESQDGFRRFICRFCGLKFNLLPDLGRHHQAAHMGPNMAGPRAPKKGIRFYAYKLKSGRLTVPRFKKGLTAASYRIRNRATSNLKKCMQASAVSTGNVGVGTHVAEATNLHDLDKLTDSQCSAVANILFAEIKKTKPHPSNIEILSIARYICCKVGLQVSLEKRYGELPECLFLKAAKLCSENNIQVEWHQEGFVCPRGCSPSIDSNLQLPMVPCSEDFGGSKLVYSPDISEDWETDEGHYIIDSSHFRQEVDPNSIVLCEDISFGQESIPIACVVDEDLLDSLHIFADGSEGQNTRCPMPWESFSYIQKPLVDQSTGLETESLQLGCSCSHSVCSPEQCDHVYLFDNDYEDAKDIYGRSMQGRFPYDDGGRIILEEGYLVYECNFLCGCSRTCKNRVLQSGIRVKLEVFKTEKKGWAVRAGEKIPRGTFVCEYIGEVLEKEEANKRYNRYDKEGSSYQFDIGAHVNDMSRLIEGQSLHVMDATRYGNVSRFINHSCSPNLISFQVLVESMDCQLAHIGLYAGQDVSMGEELTFDYRYELRPGEGSPCFCGAPNCHGRIC